ncbi:hypothetical protein Pla175_43860 [Pirellulimonas nuda]|uniref:Uncharacterized protein n=1 Tax=Pirellulimonas nuda TaxID=2528009 RepID=A0A518DHM0_9BACT|nr:hypothetical protein [Pirellulimonas nuda]QDU90971.1 hypothetical protein Pla175_43860 [Pirellulimonas nuda]
MASEQRQGFGNGSADSDDSSSFNYGTRNRANAADNRPVQGRRRGKTPQSINGIHRRRRRKMSW